MRTLPQTRKRLIKLSLFLLISAVAVILDYVSKKAATAVLKNIGSYPLWKNVFHLTYCENKGAAFSMLSGHRWVFITLTFIALTAIIASVIVFKKAGYMFFISLGMITGGGIGNMIDRLGKGYVVDFFDFTLINFAIFNVADIFVCVGVGLFALDILFIEKNDTFDLPFLKNKK